eukprot:14331639-Ditylum_brightwellii.AAC.1
MKTAPSTKQSNPNVKQALHTSPADATSPIYKLSVHFFGEETLEEWIKFQHGLQAVLKGQNVT